MNNNIHRLLTDFGKHLGLENLGLDDNGRGCLTFDGICVYIEAMDDSSLLLLYSSLGQLPEDTGSATYMRLLEANYFFQQTAGGTLGLEADTGLVVMSHVVDTANMDLLAWEAVMTAFVDAAESCAQLCNTAAGTAAAVVHPMSADRAFFA